jgi:hypothetical protein
MLDLLLICVGLFIGCMGVFGLIMLATSFLNMPINITASPTYEKSESKFLKNLDWIQKHKFWRDFNGK